jgi:hypothetical protein
MYTEKYISLCIVVWLCVTWWRHSEIGKTCRILYNVILHIQRLDNSKSKIDWLVDLNFFSVHAPHFWVYFEWTEQKIVINPYKLISN